MIIVQVPDSRQMLHFSSDAERDETANHEVRIVGLAIVDFRQVPAISVYAANRQLTLENLLYVTRYGAFVRSDGPAPLNIEQCYLWAKARNSGANPSIHASDGDKKPVGVTNCLFAGHAYVAIGGTIELKAERNTFAGTKNPWVVQDGSVTHVAERNLFWGTQNIVFFDKIAPKSSPAEMAQAARRISRYRATNNVYFECQRLCEQISSNAQSDLAAWQTFTNNGEVTPQFIDPQPVHRTAVADSQQRLLSPRLFAMRSSTPLKRLKVGAEIANLPDIPPQLSKLLPDDIRPIGQ